jgi:hypothetical protein
MRTNPTTMFVVLLVVVVSPCVVAAWSVLDMKQHPLTTYQKRTSIATATRTTKPQVQDDHDHISRRMFWRQSSGGAAARLAIIMMGLGSPGTSASPAMAAAASSLDDDALQDLKLSKTKLEPIPDLLEQKEWDKVRSILKLPPVNKLWNLGDVSSSVLSRLRILGWYEWNCI